MKYLIGILAVLLLIDWRQTLVIAQPGDWYERNPPLRWLIERFGAAGVHAWFSLAFVLIVLALWLVPGWRIEITVVLCTAELACVLNNFRLGIKP